MKELKTELILPEMLYDKVIKYAYDRDMSVSSAARDLIIKGLKSIEKER